MNYEGIIISVTPLTTSASLLIKLLTNKGIISLQILGGQTKSSDTRGICQYLNYVLVTTLNNKSMAHIKQAKLLDKSNIINLPYKISAQIGFILKLITNFEKINYELLFNLIKELIYQEGITPNLFFNFYYHLTAILGCDIIRYCQAHNINFNTIQNDFNFLQTYYLDYLGIKIIPFTE